MIESLSSVLGAPVLAAAVAQNVFFYLIAAVMIIAALRVVTTNNIVHAALFLVVVLAGAAAQFILLGAEFVGVTQVLVYIGAVIVLFLFGIMLTRAKVGAEDNLNHANLLPAMLTALLLLLVMAYAVVDFGVNTAPSTSVAGVLTSIPEGERVPSPEAGTTLVLRDGDDAMVGESQTADDGAYTFEELAEGFYTVNRSNVIEEVTLAEDDTSFSGVATPAALVRLQSESGAVIAETVSDDDGAFSFDELDEIDGFTGGDFDVRAEKVLSVESLTQPKEIDVTLARQQTTVEAVSDSIFSTYIVAFEAISVLLLAALIGAIVVARKE